MQPILLIFVNPFFFALIVSFFFIKYLASDLNVIDAFQFYGL